MDKQMAIEAVLIPAEAVRTGMVVRDLFMECGRSQVQSLPYIDETGRLKGRITLKNVLRTFRSSGKYGVASSATSASRSCGCRSFGKAT